MPSIKCRPRSVRHAPHSESPYQLVEQELRKTRRALQALSNCNQALIRATDELDLLSNICRILADIGGYDLAWVGYLEHDEARIVRAKACSGDDRAFIELLDITWDDSPRGHGPVGKCARSGQPCVVNDIRTDPDLDPWRPELQDRACLSIASFPLRHDGSVFGVLTIDSRELNSFDPSEVELLQQMADDLAYAITSIRVREERSTLEQTLRLTQASIDTSSTPIFWVRPDASIAYANDAAAAHLGYSRGELLRLTVPDIAPRYDTCDWYAHGWEWTKSARTVAYETTQRAKDGTVVPVELSATYMEFGGQEYAFCIAINISERRRMEDALRESEEKFRALAESTSTWIVIYQDERLVYVNPAVADGTGWTQDELLGMDPWDLIHQADRDSLRSRAAERLRGEMITAPQSFRVTVKGGRTCWVDAVADRTTYQGHPAILVTLHDVTGKVQTEQALRESERRFRSLSENSPVGIHESTPDGKLTYLNDAAARIVGLPRETCLATDPRKLLLPTDREQLMRSVSTFWKTERYYEFDCRIIRPDGEERWVHVTSAPVLDEGGRLASHIGTAIDITEKKRMDDAIKRLITGSSALTGQQFFESMVAQLAECLGADITIIAEFVGESSRRMRTVSVCLDGRITENIETDIAGTPCEDVLRRNQCTYIADVSATYPDAVPIRKMGARGYVGVPLLDSGDNHVGVMIVAFRKPLHDPTFASAILKLFATRTGAEIERSRMETALRDANERLQVLSRKLVEIQESERRYLARELHDEIGGMVTGLSIAVEMASADEHNLDLAKCLASELTAKVRDMSLELRPSMLDDLGLVPTLLWHFQRYTSQTNVHVDFRHSGLARRFPADVETAVYRIIQEALTNVARHAQVESVAVTVRCGARMLCLRIQDQGRGFDPGSTPALSNAAGIVGMQERAELLGGSLAVESRPGLGTCVIAMLPVGQPPAG